MGIFGRTGARGPTGNPLPDWSTDSISPQHRLAEAPPELFPLVQQLIGRAGRGALQSIFELQWIQT